MFLPHDFQESFFGGGGCMVTPYYWFCTADLPLWGLFQVERVIYPSRFVSPFMLPVCPVFPNLLNPVSVGIFMPLFL